MPSIVTGKSRGLVADIGATNARLAIVEDGRIDGAEIVSCAEHAGIESLLRSYLERAGSRDIAAAALGVPGPVQGDRIALTNRDWHFSVARLRRRFAWRRLTVINDFAANALAVPHLRRADRIAVGDARAGRPGAPVAVLGPGSGLGVSGLLAASTGAPLPIVGEGGHATLAPGDAFEARVLDELRRRREFAGHVSAERVLSGPGLVNLHQAVCRLRGRPVRRLTPAQITASDADALCRETVRLFCALLGSVAGNLALTLGAQGGVYITGGIVPRIGAARLARSAFRRRFEAKGRFRGYLQAIPTYLVVHPLPALLGLASLLRQS